MANKRIAILTGGGDAPGLNSVIEAFSKSLLARGFEIIGIRDGFEGVFSESFLNLTREVVEGIHGHAGTLLGTTNKCGTAGREKEFIEKFKKLNVSGLVALGGDGTFAGLKAFEKEIPLIGVPKTIDNDISGTEITFGFDTACSVVSESLDALRFSADAHSRIMFVECMGRNAGWIALGGGLASYADIVLIPERPFDFEQLLGFLKKRKSEGKRGLVCAISEGATEKGGERFVARRVEGSPEAERLGGIAEWLARKTENALGWESRHVVLGHLQRSRAPTTTDRFLTLAMGVQAAQLVIEEKWGMSAVYRNGLVQSAPISDLMAGVRKVDSNHRWIKLAQSVGIYI